MNTYFNGMNYLTRKKNRSFLLDHKHNPTVKHSFDNFYYKEVAKMTGAGGWSVHFKDDTRLLDAQGKKILNTPSDFLPTADNALSFYAEDERKRAQRIFLECAKGVPFLTTIKMLTFDNREFWARAAGEPMINKKGKIVGIHGVFQDIDTEKQKEVSLEKSIEVIASQNSRLFNFAHIVSHNLRSHSSNLQLTLELLNTVNSEEEEIELKNSLIDISSSLNDTIGHLNEIVTIQSKAHDEKSEVIFDDVLHNVKGSIGRLISETGAEIYSDFSEVPSIHYIPAYMDSIFLNLISNSIKYRHPERSPVIDIFTYTEDGKDCLMIKDNGSGIDLDKFGNKIFNMYQTFHQKKDSVGIGLFITRNQVEALDGTISLESKVGSGTILKIKF